MTILLHKSNIKIEINRKLFVSKHIFECSHGLFKTMPIFQTDNYNLLQMKEKETRQKNIRKTPELTHFQRKESKTKKESYVEGGKKFF